MSLRSILVVLVLTSCVAVSSAAAQTPVMPSGESMQELLELAKEAMNPAATALTHREALALTADQVARLEELSASLRPVIETLTSASSPLVAATAPATGASAPVDREAIRSAYMQQAERQADVMIVVTEAVKQVEMTLTPAQLRTLQDLQRAAMMEMMRSMGFTPPPSP